MSSAIPLATTVAPHLFWLTSRAAGTAALVLSSASVGVGVAMAGNLVGGRKPDLRLTHEALSLATMVALVVHAVTLLGDSFIGFGVADISVPFASGYRAPWMGLGMVGGWALIVLGLSYYARGRIGLLRWKKLHRFAALAWVLGLAHSLGTGTDAGERWFLVLLVAVTIPAAVLGTARIARAQAGRVPTDSRTTPAT